MRLVDAGTSVDRTLPETSCKVDIVVSYLSGIACVVSVVNQYMHDPKSADMEVVNRILRYLKGC